VKVPVSVGVDAPSGVEGIAYDWDRKGWWIAREKTPAQLMMITNDASGVWFTNNWFSSAQMATFTNANNTDFSALYLDRENQILWVGQDEGGQFDRVLGIDLITSNLLFTVVCTNFGQLEGVSMTPDGKLLVAGEANQFAIYEPVYHGLNTGMGWDSYTLSTNGPAVPFFSRGASVGTFGVYLTNWFSTNITLNFPVITAFSETNLNFAFTAAADGDEVTVTPSPVAYTAGTTYHGVASNGVVYVVANNYSAGAPNPASATFRVTLRKWR
jgi:hypothetical protein